MATTAGQILTRAATVLQDATFVRWLLPELADWLNEAQRAIVLAKPSANAVTVDIEMVSGTLQSLGAEERLFLLRLPRNLKGAAAPFTGGRAIRPTARATLDASQPNWHDNEEVRFKDEVRQYIYDESNPREFFVYPGNTGDGRVEAVVSVLPTMIATTGTEIGDYSGAIGLPEPYAPVILDYILYRAFAKDDIAAEVTRSQLHYRAFAEALGIKIQVEGASSPNSRAGLART
jgi:hypothetical protein